MNYSHDEETTMTGVTDAEWQEGESADNELLDAQLDHETVSDDELPPDCASSDTVYSQRVFQDSRQNKRYSVLLVGACIVIMAALYFLGLRHRGATSESQASGTVSTLDLAMAKLQVDLQENKNAQAIINRLVNNPASRQIERAELYRNPFQPMGRQFGQDDATAKQKRQNRIKELETAFKTFSLESIVFNSAAPTCMINGELYQHGEKVTTDFTVKEIAHEKVVLLAEDAEFVLSF